MTARHRGEVWLAQLDPPDKVRPVVLVSRAEAYERRALVTYVPVTSRLRPLPTHVLMDDVGIEGLEGAANCDLLETIRQSKLLERLGRLPDWKIAQLDEALRLSLGLG